MSQVLKIVLQGATHALISSCMESTRSGYGPGYRPNKDLLNDPTPLVICTKDLMGVPNQAVRQMREEAREAFQSFGVKFKKDLELKAHIFAEAARNEYENVKGKAVKIDNEMDLFLDTILYSLVTQSGGQYVYSADFGTHFKGHLAKCGVDDMTLSTDTTTPTNKQVSKYGKVVDARMKKHGWTEENGYTSEKIEAMRNELILKADENSCSGAKDSVKFSLVESLFNGVTTFAKGLFYVGAEAVETTVELGIALLTGHVVEIGIVDEIFTPGKDNQVRSHGPHAHICDDTDESNPFAGKMDWSQSSLEGVLVGVNTNADDGVSLAGTTQIATTAVDESPA